MDTDAFLGIFCNSPMVFDGDTAFAPKLDQWDVCNRLFRDGKSVTDCADDIILHFPHLPKIFYAAMVLSFLSKHIFLRVMPVKRIFMTVGLLSAAVLLCLYPEQCKDAVRSSVCLCGTTVIPSLFPFFIVSKLLIATLGGGKMQGFSWMNRFFGVDGECGSALLMSFLGGYPIGVHCVATLYRDGRICKRDAQQALLFCNNSGPAFFVSVIGATVLKSVRLGLVLYLIHILAALTVGRLVCIPQNGKVNVRRVPEADRSFSQELVSAVAETAQTLLQICAYVTVFAVLVVLLRTLAPFPPVCYGLLELTGGILALDEGGFVAASFFMGWGGLCVHLQAMSIWQGAELSPTGYFAAKLLHGLISALYALTFLHPSPLYFALCAVCLIFCIVLPKFRKKSSGNRRQLAL